MRAAIPAERMIRVFLVDDQSLVRAGLKLVIDAQPDMTVVGEAGDGRAALEALAVTTADVVLMDVRMPELDGVAATARLIERDGDAAPRVIVLTTFDLDEYVFSALRAGASGFLLKDAEPEELLAAIRAVASGDAVVAPSATRRLLEQVGSCRARATTRPAPGDAHRAASATCCSRSPAARPTPRSARSSTWPRPRSRPTSAGC